MGLLGRLLGLARVCAVTGASLGALGFALLVAFQRKVYYVPNLPGAPREVYPLQPGQVGLRCEEVWLRAEDGVRLHAWLCGPPAATRGPTLLFLQENAGNISHRLGNAKDLVKHLGCNLLLLSYRGYGRSDGTPSEAGLQADAQAALGFLQSAPGVDPRRLFVFGRSLGGAVAAALAAANPGALRGVVLENTFTSIPAMATVLFPPLAGLIGPGRPLAFLVRDTWDTLARVPRIAAPLLFICSGRDEMVPPAQMRRLHAAARGPRVSWLELPEASHMDAWMVGKGAYWEGLSDFVRANGGYAQA